VILLAPITQANGENLDIEGVATVAIKFNGASSEMDVIITRDLSGLILGVDWMRKQGLWTWDFDNDRVRCGDGKWVELLKEEKSRMVRRCYVDRDTVLNPSGQTEVDVRITRKGIDELPFEGVSEPENISTLPRVYAGRSLVPAKFSDIKVPVLNATEQSQVLTRGTEIGVVEPVELLDNGSAVADEVRSDTTEVDVELTEPEAEVIVKMMASLPSELDEEQRAKVEALLIRRLRIRSSLRRRLIKCCSMV